MLSLGSTGIRVHQLQKTLLTFTLSSQDLVAHVCYPKLHKMWRLGGSRSRPAKAKKFARTYLNRKNVEHGSSHLSYQQHRKLKIGGSMIQARLGKNQDPIYKITRAKSVGGMTQTAQGLPGKHKHSVQTLVLPRNFFLTS
jgi:hypothetical protein